MDQPLAHNILLVRKINDHEELADPEGKLRQLDDRRNALDHFPKKLLTLQGSFKTSKGQELARDRHQRLLEFYRGMLSEAQP
jgi:uncharacterized protein